MEPLIIHFPTCYFNPLKKIPIMQRPLITQFISLTVEQVKKKGSVRNANLAQWLYSYRYREMDKSVSLLICLPISISFKFLLFTFLGAIFFFFSEYRYTVLILGASRINARVFLFFTKETVASNSGKRSKIFI